MLDGAILVLCSVGGVQSQSLTVDRQMKRYHVPRLAFINKMDRTGANHTRVVEQVREKMGCDAVLMQWPIGKEENFEGMIDLITMKAYYFDGTNGEKVREEAIPPALLDDATNARKQMLEGLSMYSDELMELLLSEETVSEELIHTVVRDAVQTQDMTPVYMGTAYKNKGVQLLLDAITRYLPSPLDRPIKAKNWEHADQDFPLEPDPAKPFVGMAFKIVEDPFGQLTFMRIYQGTIQKGETFFNQRTHVRSSDSVGSSRCMPTSGRKSTTAGPGDIVAVMGIDCASGDTYASQNKYCTLESMFIPDPVIKMAINPANREGADKLGKALARFRKEDPTFRVATDEETSETVIAGMGELHLAIFTSSGCAANTGSRSKSAHRRSAIAKRRPRRPNSISSTRSKPAVRDNLPISVGKLECLPDDAEERSSSSKISSWVAAFPASTFLAWKKASAIRSTRDRWPNSPSWV